MSRLALWTGEDTVKLCFPQRTKDVRRRPAKEKRPAVSQGCQTDLSTLKSTSLASIKANWKIALRQGVKVPSPDIFAAHRSNAYASIPSRHCRHGYLYLGNLRYRTVSVCRALHIATRPFLLFFLFLVSPVHHRPHVLSPVGPCQLSASRFPLTEVSFVLQDTRSAGAGGSAVLPPAAPRPVP